MEIGEHMDHKNEPTKTQKQQTKKTNIIIQIPNFLLSEIRVYLKPFGYLIATRMG